MRPVRSFLFIPGDSDRKLAKADESGADAVIIDLEDAVAPAYKEAARETTAAFLAERPPSKRGPQLWVRVNPLDTHMTEEDLTAIMPFSPDGIVHPKPEGASDVRKLSELIDIHESRHRDEPIRAGILPIATETAAAPFKLGTFADARLDRLAGLTWGAEDLAAALGATGNRGPDGEWLFTYKMVRSMTLMAAHAAGVPAIETLHADFRDEDGLRATSRAARAEGFSGRLCIHPAQVGPVNESFMPGLDEVEEARKIVAAFEAEPGAGTVGIEGKMYDVPHLKAAKRTIAVHEAFVG